MEVRSSPGKELVEGLVEQKASGSPAPGTEAGKAPNQMEAEPDPFMNKGNYQTG